jgi:hypothetical protein
MTEIKRKSWEKPWGYKESVAIVAGLFLVGIMLDFLSRSLVVLPGWPYNVVVGSIFMALIPCVYFSFRKIYLVRWLSEVPACLGAIALFSLIALAIAVIPQVSEEQPAMVLKLNKLQGSWLFIIASIYLLTTLGLVTVRRISTFKISDIGFVLSHLGMWIVVVAAGLSSSDLKRYQLAIEEDQITNRAYDKNYNWHTLPFAVKLYDFRIDEFPAKLALVKSASMEIESDVKNNLPLIEKDKVFKINGYRIEVVKYLPSANLDSVGGFVESDDSLSVQAAYLKCFHIETGKTKEGWICSSSPEQSASVLTLDSVYLLAMTLPEPKKFSSKIEVIVKEEKSKEVLLEVNKPYAVGGWKLYQTGYDKEKGKYSRLSIIEAVRDPWIPVVYLGIILSLAGIVITFWTKKKTEYKW